MYTQLCSKLGIVAGADAVSQAVSMEDNNTAAVEVTVFTGGIKVEYQQSNDLENWSVAGTLIGPLTNPYNAVAKQVIDMAYVRVRWVETGAAAVVIAGGIDLSDQ